MSDKLAVIGSISAAIERNLQLLGQDTNREGIKGTPTRHAKYLWEFLKESQEEPFNVTDFDAEGAKGMVFKADIDFCSLCEHHILPFIGVAHIAYIPKGRVIGISKLPRIVRRYSRRLQIQERLTKQIAGFLSDQMNTVDVAVQMVARHTCEEIRGIESIGSPTITTHLMGAFDKDANTRQEFFMQIQNHAVKRL